MILAFFTCLRLILPESTPARNYLPSWLLQVLSVFLPLVAHIPLYLLLHYSESISCKEQALNRITIHMRDGQTFDRPIATYFATAESVGKTLEEQLVTMGLFPINLQELTDNQLASYKLPSSVDDGLFNIRNDFDIFGQLESKKEV